MGSIGAAKITTEPVKGLIFGTAAIRPNTIDIDGYSNKKTLAGALKELARAVDKYDTGEGDYIRTMVSANEMNPVYPDKNAGPDQYIIEWEEVPSAGRYNAQDEYETKDANYYLHVRFGKR